MPFNKIEHESEMELAHKPDLTETTVSSERVFDGRVIKLRRDQAKLSNGQPAYREVVEHPGGVVVLPIRDDGRILFVEQFRYPLGHTLLELPAGKLEPNEPPADAIRRELTEETGYAAEQWEELTYIYTSPGFCNEKLWLYKATGLRKLYHVDEHTINPFDPDEMLHVFTLSPEEAFTKIRSREIVDAKTICLLGLVYHFCG